MKKATGEKIGLLQQINHLEAREHKLEDQFAADEKKLDALIADLERKPKSPRLWELFGVQG